MTCTLVIPHFHDAMRLAPYLRDLLRVLPADFTIVVVDDGSGDQGFADLEGVIADVRGKSGRASLASPLRLEENSGKGAAVYAGWRRGTDADWLGFVDADGATPATEVLRGWELVNQDGEIDVLAASRCGRDGREVERRWVRHWCGRIFAGFVATVSGLALHDTQCGFKLVRSSVFRRVDPILKADRFAFDVELLMALQAAGGKIREFPVDWRDIPGGKVSVWKHSVSMLVEVIRAKQNLGSGPAKAVLREESEVGS